MCCPGRTRINYTQSWTKTLIIICCPRQLLDKLFKTVPNFSRYSQFQLCQCWSCTELILFLPKKHNNIPDGTEIRYLVIYYSLLSQIQDRVFCKHMYCIFALWGLNFFFKGYILFLDIINTKCLRNLSENSLRLGLLILFQFFALKYKDQGPVLRALQVLKLQNQILTYVVASFQVVT